MKKVLSFFCIFSFFTLVGMDTILVERNRFFEHVMGISESEFQKSNKHQVFIKWQEDENVYYLKKLKEERILSEGLSFFVMEGEEFCAGKFSALSLKQLREKTTNIQNYGGTFNVIEAVNPLGTSYYKYVDIGAHQADSKNRDAVFQVASNFNALELVGSNDPMKTITDYTHDLTQGPFASISAAPGLILRHYFMFYDGETDQKEWQQYPVLGRLWQKSDSKKQINFLEDTDIPVVNSYVAFSKRAPKNVKNFSVEAIKIGWHEKIQVTSGLIMPTMQKHAQINDPEQIINQVFTAAVDFESNAAYQNDEKAIEIAQAILDAAYEGTLRAAAAHGKKKVFLTLIGGGVFRNKLAWIANSLEKMKQFITISGLEVTLIIFDGNDNRLTGQIVDFRKRMQNLVQNTGGEYVQYASGYPEGKTLVAKKEAHRPERQKNLIGSLQFFTNSLYQVKNILNK